MEGKQLDFALASRRFFLGARWIARLPFANIRIARRWGRIASPYAADKEDLQNAYMQAFQASPQVAQSLTQQWLASHGLFGTSIFAYRHMGAAWVKRHVRIEEPDILDALRSKGGLVLTYHTHHHNTLGIVLGQSGVTTWGVAATEKASPMAPYTGSFMRIINGQSEAKFAGGRYLFTDEPRQLLKGLKQAFGNNQAVVSLCDNPTPSGSQPPIHFLGKTFHVGSGVLELALEQGVPVTLAILYPDLNGSYVLRMKTISSDQSASQILQTYFDFLASCVVQVPWAWQGWHWFSGLPKLERS